MQTAPAVPRKVLFAASFGTFIEWYDFLAFGVLAAYIGKLFFPPDNPTAGLLASLATFGIGMLVRPLGAAVFGSLADRHGRRPVFIATLLVMSAATLGVGVLPTYATIGMAAPILLLLLRLVQGFAMGGEVGGVAVYLTEHAPAGKRGLATSVLQLMGALGVAAALAQIALLQSWVGDARFIGGWWRELFVFSGVLMLIFLVQRMSLQESPVFLQLAESKRIAHTPLRDCLTDRRTLGRMALLFFCVTAGGSLLFFSSQIYTKLFLETVVRLDGAVVAGLVMVSTLALIPLTVLAGWLSDRIGRKPVMLAGLLLGAVCIQPVYSGLLHYGNPALERFSRDIAVVVYADACRYNPFVKPDNDCARSLDFLTKHGVSYTLQPAQPAQALSISIGGVNVAGFQPQALSAALKAKGWAPAADPSAVNRLALALLLLVPTLALALVTGPQTAVLAELFPARTRYTAASLPHNLSAGWIGGLSPFMVTLLSVQLGNVTAGLWYLVILLAVAFGIGLMFLPETRDVPLHE
ncbi:MAG TPA: MFS transporter [Gallionellaceae bacterium]|nr:MFS transporter [Gallionellaceae bacterium]